MTDADHHLRVLVVGPESELREEIESAFDALGDVQPLMRYAEDFRRAVESARSWQPRLALVEMTDVDRLRTLTDEFRKHAPDTAIVALFRPDVFPPEVAESVVMIEAIRAGVQDFVRRPVSRGDLVQIVGRLGVTRRTEAARAGKIISFTSNKGGVGKSTLAVNVACGLARRHPERVLLIDFSLQMGVCSTLLDLTPKTTILDAATERDRLDETLIRQLATPHECGLDLLAAPFHPADADAIDDEIASRILTLSRRAYDFVVIDTFPLLERVVTAVLDLSDLTFVVLDNVVPTVLSGARFVELLDGLEVDRARRRVALNRYSTTGANPAVADVEERLGVPVDHVIPFHESVMVAANTGRPFVLSGTRGGWFRRRKPARAVARIVDEIDELTAGNGAVAGRAETNGHALEGTS